MERSPRDLVARASFLEVVEGRGTPNGGVWIDVSHLGAETVEATFRGMVKRCRDFGRDLARTPVEVGPTTHFMMGGVVIDTACRTAIEGLFAAGEDTGGVQDRKSTRLNSSHLVISYAVFCLKKKKIYYSHINYDT